MPALVNTDSAVNLNSVTFTDANGAAAPPAAGHGILAVALNKSSAAGFTAPPTFATPSTGWATLGAFGQGGSNKAGITVGLRLADGTLDTVSMTADAAFGGSRLLALYDLDPDVGWPAAMADALQQLDLEAIAARTAMTLGPGTPTADGAMLIAAVCIATAIDSPNNFACSGMTVTRQSRTAGAAAHLRQAVADAISTNVAWGGTTEDVLGLYVAVVEANTAPTLADPADASVEQGGRRTFSLLGTDAEDTAGEPDTAGVLGYESEVVTQPTGGTVTLVTTWGDWDTWEGEDAQHPFYDVPAAATGTVGTRHRSVDSEGAVSAWQDVTDTIVAPSYLAIEAKVVATGPTVARTARIVPFVEWTPGAEGAGSGSLDLRRLTVAAGALTDHALGGGAEGATLDVLVDGEPMVGSPFDQSGPGQRWHVVNRFIVPARAALVAWRPRSMSTGQPLVGPITEEEVVVPAVGWRLVHPTDRTLDISLDLAYEFDESSDERVGVFSTAGSDVNYTRAEASVKRPRLRYVARLDTVEQMHALERIRASQAVCMLKAPGPEVHWVKLLGPLTASGRMFTVDDYAAGWVQRDVPLDLVDTGRAPDLLA